MEMESVAMTINERVAYIKGLAEGLGLEEGKKETKIINAMLELLEEMAASLTDCEDDIISLGEEVDAISEDLSDLEDDIYEDEDDEEDEDEESCGCGCGCKCGNDEDEEEFECDCDDVFEFTCPDCGEKLFLDEEVLDAGEIKCAACGKVIEFEIVDECDCDIDDSDEE